MIEPQDFIKMCEDAIQKVVEQGYPSVEKDMCMYKSPVGCCVVGHMMPNDFIRERADKLADDAVFDSSIRGVIESNTWGRQFNSSQVDVLDCLQLEHDYQENYNDAGKLLPINKEEYLERSYEVLDCYKSQVGL